MILALAGNPNCGKTTLFNALTGANARTGNFPGVTVTRSESVCRARPEITLVDLPGVYALRPYSDEERVTRSYLLGGAADAVISIADVLLVICASSVVISTFLPSIVSVNRACCGVTCVTAEVK